MTKQSILKNLPLGLGFMAFIIGSIGLYLKSLCAPTGWGSAKETFTNLCYSDVGPLYFGRGLSENLIPYFEISKNTSHVEYPVLTGLQMWLANTLSNLTGKSSFSLYVYITWILNLILIVFAVMIFGKLRKANAESSWWFAFSPAILLVLAINWDALPVLAIVCALFYWQRERPLATGVMIAIGTAAKLFPAFLLPAVILDALRKRNYKAIAQVTFSSVSIWVLINLPVYVNAQDGWWHFYDFSKSRGIDFGSIYLALAFLFDIETPAKMANTIGLIAVLIAGLIALIYRRKLNVNETLLLLLGTFLLFNKVYSPQYWLWLTPVVALVLKSRWHWIAWNLTQLVYFVGIWRYLLFLQDEKAAGAINQQVYSAILLVQWIGLLATIYFVIKKAIKGSSR